MRTKRSTGYFHSMLPDVQDLITFASVYLVWTTSYIHDPYFRTVVLPLTGIASQLLDVQFRTEDALISAGPVAIPAAEAADVARFNSALGNLRSVIPQISDIIGKTMMASAYDATAVNEAFGIDERLPGVSAAQLKAVREAHTKRQAEVKKLAEAAQLLASRSHYLQNYFIYV